MDQRDEKPQVNISVRSLVEFLLRSGDIEEGQGMRDGVEAMQQGGRIHRKLQKREGAFYHAEFPLNFQITYEEYDLGIEGRADGILFDEEDENSSVTIDEIKGIYADVMGMTEPIQVHLAQAKCYAYMFAAKRSMEKISVRMTYCNLDTEEIKRFQKEYVMDELESWFYELICAYKPWADFQYEWNRMSRESIHKITFPFAYREGQKKLAQDVYRSILREKLLFIQAPTGTGKTIATIFPSVKSVGEGLCDRIFYLTAKTAAASVARDTFALLSEQGYRAKTVVITAKDKVCPLPERKCNPLDCPYAKGHYDRINGALYALLQEKDMISREVLREFADNYRVCPFELCLDAASWADNVICDYNYVFDPQVYLKRFFAEGRKENYLFLVDEAHNLVERAREMYSQTLVKESFLEMKKLLKPISKKTASLLDRCNRIFLVWKRNCENMLLLSDADEMIFAIMNVCTDLSELLQKNLIREGRDQVMEFYFDLRNFLRLSEELDEHYRVYCDFDGQGRFCLHLFCVDPSRLLQERLDRGRTCVFFSATLLPVSYYKELLCQETDVYAIYADSFFDRENRLLCIANDVTSKYTRRTQGEYEKYASYIYEIIRCKTGNYMIFFPSYRFLDEVYEKFLEKSLGRIHTICQTANMSERQKEEFLEEFSGEGEGTLAAFCVMGGAFSEGIDLVKDQLIGSILVGAGLPQIGVRRDLMRQYFDDIGKDGFAYAYLYPGMNKVIQAAGRVIRTGEDQGIIALLDYRFLQQSYQQTFPREWSDYRICSLNTIRDMTQDFWRQREDSEKERTVKEAIKQEAGQEKPTGKETWEGMD